MRTLLCTVAAVLMVATASATAPKVVGTSMTTVTYDQVGAGTASFSRELDHLGSTIADATSLTGATNIGAFNAVDTLGRRTVVRNNGNPQAQTANESLMRHGVYKIDANDNPNRASDFFANVDVNGNVTYSVENIKFDQPVTVIPETFLLHVLFDNDQIDSLGPQRAYTTPHNHYLAENFRDFDSFFGVGLPFTDAPTPNYIENAVTPVIEQIAADEISVSVTFPYALLQHLQDDGQGVPGNQPGPGGFLEPFHFHMEYLVTPEPTTALLLLSAGLLLRRR